MTDFYKKIYGYEDDIQLKDDDVKILENGMYLQKMNQSKEDFNKRLYRLDLINNQLVATTKEFRKKEKAYPLISLNEVKIGCSSDNLKAYKLKKLGDKKKDADLECLAFCITYDNYRKTIDLLAPNEMEQLRWVRVLSYFILLSKKRKGVLPETDIIMRNYFEIADTSRDRCISESEVSDFLKSKNLKISKKGLASLMKGADANNDGVLEEDEFQELIFNLHQRQEIHNIFKTFGEESMTLEKFIVFVRDFQKEDLTEIECRNIIEDYEIDEECKLRARFSIGGFVNYLMDDDQHIQKPHAKVYQNMDQPIFNFFVNSSHNTYLSGDQLTSKSSSDCYRAAIMDGARLLEMDVYDGPNNQPIIYHQKTLTTKILFEEAIVTCKEYAFKISEYPLIITIELHCSPEGQKDMVDIIKKHLFDYLYTFDFNEKQYPSMNQLKRKIIFRCKNPQKVELTTKEDEYEDYDEGENIEQIKELSDLLNVMQNVSFKGVQYNFLNYKQNQSCSLSEISATKLIDTESAENIIKLTQNYLLKIYPAFFRTDSSNLSAIDYWTYGFQIAALNFQTNDDNMNINRALFSDNGNCGYVLKPQILLDSSLYFDPGNQNTMKNKKLFEINIISGQNLPEGRDIIKDISDPYVTLSTHGVKCDNHEFRTKTVKDNGFNPVWNEVFQFDINCPELAFIKFTVRDEDFGKDQLIGDFTIRLQNIRQGYRHLRLCNKESKGSLFVAIRIKEFQPLSELLSYCRLNTNS